MSVQCSFSKGLEGRVALVTGASGGLGRHFAMVLAAHGARVALAARRVDRLTEVQREIARAGGQAAAIAMDVSDAASVASGFDAAARSLGPVDVVVNNAGVVSEGRCVDTSEHTWHHVIEVNLNGVFRVAREAARRKSDRGAGGAIVNIASILGLGVLKGLAPYATTKAAVIQLTKAMALELARDRVRVNALAPGYFSTELNETFLAGSSGRRLVSRIPMRRIGVLDELDAPLLLLCSDAGAFMTGSVVTVDGGHAMAMG
ncbi:MAG: SDR family oxidoreductase [Hyphomicrobiaceae bacterium]|nr:MAG: SDR family oxidoreductase [Hyphomicrobiaceae bacterium]